MMTEGSARGSLYFSVSDVGYPCVEHAAMSPGRDRLELVDGGPEPDPPLILLQWPSSVSPPDFIWAASTRLFVSSRVLLRWQLEANDAVTLVPVRLVSPRGRTIAVDYWWVNIREAHAIMDENGSEVERSGRLVLRVKRFEVNWDLVPTLDLFICLDVYSPVFSERYVRAARKSGFTGAYFVEVNGGMWPPR